MKNYIFKIQRNYYDYGWYITFKKLFSKILSPVFLRRRYRIYAAELKDMEVSESATKNITVKKISYDDYDIIAQIERMEEWLSNQVSERIKNQSLCIAAVEGDIVAGFNLISFGEIYIPLIEQKRTMGQDDAWSDQISVKRQFRKLGLGKAIRYTAIKELQKLGTKTFYGGTMADNRPSLSLARSIGFKEIVEIHFFKILGYKFWKNHKVPHESDTKN